MQLNRLIDHTNLKADATKADIKKLVDEAVEHDFFSVCVNSSFVKFIKEYNDQVTLSLIHI